MSVLSEERPYTPEDLLLMPDGDRYELVDGRLVEVQMGGEASWIGGEIYGFLRNFNRTHRCGWVFPPETSFQCFSDDPSKVRRADAAFIARGRLDRERIPRGHIKVVPDLVAEVVSPNDLFSEVRTKIEEYLGAGVGLVWVIDPDTRTVDEWRAQGLAATYHADDELAAEHLLPGFRCRVSDLFPTGDSEQE